MRVQISRRNIRNKRGKKIFFFFSLFRTDQSQFILQGTLSKFIEEMFAEEKREKGKEIGGGGKE